jgi:hypothetical protein
MELLEVQLRRLLAAELRLPEATLTDTFRWLDDIGAKDCGYLLARLNDALTKVPQGFSFGSGKLPFDRMEP